jgi:hypothetical protein
LLAKQVGVPTVFVFRIEDDKREVSISMTMLGNGDIQPSCDLVKSLEEGLVVCNIRHAISSSIVGTPPGVGPVRAGQRITAGITGHIEMSFPVVRRRQLGGSAGT